jgi:site-specific DNA-methyltransferase (adenine-specific)
MSNKKVKLMLGDNISSLKKLPDNSIDSVVTDPPYGLSFMGKKWDYDVPSVEFWSEVYRVLKPGGHVLSFGGTRTYHRMTVNIEDAGFEIRDQIMWLYGSGFPKSRNIGKDIEKINVGGLDKLKQIGTKKGTVATNHHELATKDKPKGFSYKTASHTLSHSEVATARTQTTGDIPVYEINNEFGGWGTALKPANEPICVARKPLSEKSVALNVLKWGTGGINIDGCRVGSEEIKRGNASVNNDEGRYNWNNGTSKTNPDYKPDETPGRFPANIILECLCDEVIKGEKGEVKRSGSRDRTKHDYNSVGNFGSKKGAILAPDNYNDKGDIHTNPMCPCYMLDEQSGVSKSNCKSGVVEGKSPGQYNNYDQRTEGSTAESPIGYKKKIMVGDYNDKGGASRFFYQAKVSKAERNMGLDGFEDKIKNSLQVTMSDGVIPESHKRFESIVKNNHPTVKPVNLMAYLCRLVTPPNGIVLDPFCGSGSTGIAAQLEGFRFCGMEMDEDYFKIAEARINDYESYRKFLNKK